MKPPFAYTIRHLRLDDIAKPFALDPTPGAGWYLVFWWKNLPLAHLYLEPGEPADEAAVLKKAVPLLRQTLQTYAPDRPAPPDEAGPDRIGLHRELEAVLRPRNVETLPSEVPVSVVLCTRNRAAHLRQCLRSLRSLDCRPAEIVVVDNAPVDDSTREVVREFPGVVYCREPRPGLDIARNTGYRHARSPVVAYTDDDVQVHPHWVYQVWKSFRNPAVAAMTGLVIAAELQTEAQLIFEKHWSFNRGYTDKFYDQTFFENTLPFGPPVWEIGAGASMAFRRRVLEAVGGFDERLDVGAAGCNGDSEMWFRVLNQGHTIHYNPRAVAFHTHRRELSALKNQLFHYMRGHTAAALVQREVNRQAGYLRHVFVALPKYYYWLVREGYPSFSFRHQTLGEEAKGMLSGLLFYLRNRKRRPDRRGI
ncbi:glycosyltransferase [Larkinella soli]|uniref:glycosyltransferase n=1 Tax=Larkinella soli TaxID=1770527 RepID=UPI000FFC57DA|nr:glycosyltransferase family 2 protein [Larkinella soli]